MASTRTKSLKTLLLGSVFLFSTTTFAWADDFGWEEDSNNNWNNAGRWSGTGGQYPDGNDDRAFLADDDGGAAGANGNCQMNLNPGTIGAMLVGTTYGAPIDSTYSGTLRIDNNRTLNIDDALGANLAPGSAGTPGGHFLWNTTGNVGTLLLGDGNSQLNIDGDFLFLGAAVTNNGTITFTNGNTAVHNWTGRTGINFGDVVVATGTTVRLLSNVTVDDLTVDGTLDLNGFTVTVNGNLTVDGSILSTEPSSGLTFNDGGTSTFTSNTNTSNFGAITLNGGTTVNLAGTTTAFVASSVTTNNNSDEVGLGSETLNLVGGAAGGAPDATATPLSLSGTSTLSGTGTLSYQGANNVSPVTIATTGVSNTTSLEINNSGITFQPVGAAIDVAGVTLTDGTLNMNGQNLTAGSGGITLTAGALTAGPAISNGGVWSNAGATFTAGSSTVTFNGGAGQAITTNSQSFNNVVVTGGSTDAQLGSTTTITGSLTVQSSGQLSLANNTLNVAGTVNGTGGTLTTGGSSTVVFNGTGQTVTLSGTFGSGANDFDAITVNQTNPTDVVAVSGATFTTNGNVTVQEGILEIGDNDATFAGTGTVTIENGGTLRNLSNANSRTYTFTVNTGGLSVDVQSGGTFQFTDADANTDTLLFDSSPNEVQVQAGGTFTVTGNSAANRIAMRDQADPSNDPSGTKWNFDASGTVNVTYAIIEDSNVVVGTPSATDSLNQSSAGWNFIFTKVWTGANINGVGGNGWGNAGNWNPVGVPTAATPVLFDGGVAFVCSINAGTGAVALSITMDQSGGGNANTLRFDDPTLANTTLTASGSVTVGTNSTIDINGVAGTTRGKLIANGGLTISGGTVQGSVGNSGDSISVDATSFNMTSGTYTEGTGTTNVSGAMTVSAGTWNDNAAATDLLVLDGGSPQTWSTGTINVGEASITGAGGVTLGGNVRVSSLNLAAGSLSIGGNELRLTGSGTPFTITGAFNANTGTVTYTGTGAVTVTASANYFNLTLNNAAGAYSLGGTSTVAGTLDITAGSFTQSNQNLTLSLGPGTPISATGAFNGGTGTTSFTGTGAVVIPVTNCTYANITVDNAAGTYTQAGNLLLGSGGGAAGVLTITNGTYTVGNDQTLSFRGSSTSPLVDSANGFSVSTGGSGNAAVIYQPSANGTYTVANEAFNVLTVNRASSNFRLAGVTSINSSLNVTAGTFQLGATVGTAVNTLTTSGRITVSNGAFLDGGTASPSYDAADFVLNGTYNEGGGNTRVTAIFRVASTATWNPGAGQVRLEGNGTVSVESNSTNDVGAVNVIGTTTAVLQQNGLFTSLALAGTFQQGPQTLTLSGSASTPLTGTLGNFTAGAGTTIYTGTGVVVVANATYNNLTLNGAGTYRLAGNTVCNGDVNVLAGALQLGAALGTTNTLTATSGTLTVANGTSLQGGASDPCVNVQGFTLNGTYTEGAGDTRITSAFSVAAAGANWTSGSGIVQLAGTVSWSGGGTVDVGAVNVASGTTSLVTNNAVCTSLNLAGNFDQGARTLTVSGGTPITGTLGNFAGGTGTTNFTNGGTVTVPNVAYANLTVNTGTYNQGSDISVGGLLNVASGSYNVGNNNNLSLTGSATNPLQTTGTFNAGTGTSAVIYQPSADATYTVSSETYNVLTVNRGGTTSFRLASSASINSSLNVSAGTFQLGPTVATAVNTLTTSGRITVANGATLDGGTTDPSYNAVDLVLDGTYNEGAGDTRVTGIFRISGTASWTSGSGIVQLDGNGTVSVEADSGTDVGAVRVVGTTTAVLQQNGLFTSLALVGSFQQQVYQLTLSGAGVPITGTLGNFTAGTGTTLFVGAGAVTVPVVAYHHLAVNNGAGTFTLAGSTTCTGNVNVTGGALRLGPLIGSAVTLTATSGTLTVDGSLQGSAGTGVPALAANVQGFTHNGVYTEGAGSIRVTGTFTVANSITWTDGGGEVRLDGGGTVDWDGGSGATPVGGVLVVAGTTGRLINSNAITTTLDIQGVFQQQTRTVTLTAAGTPLTIAGTFTPGTGTTAYTGGATNVTATTYYNLTVNGTGPFTQAGDVAVSNILTVTAGTYGLGASNNLTFIGTSGTPLSVSGGFNGGSGTARVIYQLSGTGPYTIAGVAYHGLEVDQSGQTFRLGGNTTLGGTLNVTNGTFDTNGSTLSVTGATTVDDILDLDNDAVFTGAVSINGTLRDTSGGANSHSFGSTVGINAGSTFQFTTSAHTLTFTEGAGGQVTVNATATFTVNGSSGNLIVLQDASAGGAQWLISTPNQLTVSFVILRDSNVSLTVPQCQASDSTNDFNNTNWFFPGKTTSWDSGGDGSSWNDANNWSNGRPQDNDIVIFNASADSTVQDIGPLSLASFTVNNGFTGTITLNNSLTVNGVANLNFPGAGGTRVFNTNGQQFAAPTIQLQNGTLTTAGGTVAVVASNMTVNGGLVNMTGAGDIRIQVTLTVNGGSWTHGGSTGVLQFTDDPQTVANGNVWRDNTGGNGLSYGPVEISCPGGGLVQLNSAGNGVQIDSLTFVAGNNASADFDINSEVLTVRGNLATRFVFGAAGNTVNDTGGGGTIRYSGTFGGQVNVQSTNITTSNLVIDEAGQTFRLAADLSVANDATVTNGTLTVAGQRLTVTDTLTVNDTLTGGPGTGVPGIAVVTSGLTLTGTYNESDGYTQVRGALIVSGTWVNDNGGRVQLNGVAPQILNGGGVDIGEVEVANGASVTLSTTAAIISTLTLTGTGALSQGTQNLTLSGDGPGNVISGGGFDSGTGTTTTYSGTGSPIGGYTYQNLTISGGGTHSVPAGNVDVNGVLDLQAGTLSLGVNTLNLRGNGAVFIGAGALAMGNTGRVNYSGTGAVTVRAGTYTGFLEFTGGGTYTLGGNIIHGNGTSAAQVLVTSGTLDLGASNNLTTNSRHPTTPVQITGTFVGGTGTSTMTFACSTGGLTQDIPAVTYNNLTTNPTFAAAVYQLTGTTTVSNTFSLLNGSFLAGTNQLNLTGTGSVFAGTPGLFNGGTGRVVYSGGAATTVAAANYYNLRFTGAGPYNLAGTSVGASGDVEINNGTVNMVNANFSVNSGAPLGVLTVANGATLTGSTTSTRFLTVRNLVLNGTYNEDVAGTRLQGDLTIDPATGSWINDTSPTAFLDFLAGTQSWDGGNTDVGEVRISGGSTVSAVGSAMCTTLNVQGSYSQNAQLTRISGAGTPLTISGTFNVGTGTTEYSNGGAVTITAVTGGYYNLSLIGGGTSSLTGAGTNLIVSNLLSMTGDQIVVGSGRTLTLGGGGTPWTGGTLSLGGGTVSYTGAGAVNVRSGITYDGTLSFNNASGTYALSGSGTTTTLGSGATLGLLQITNGTFSLGTNNDLNLSGTSPTPISGVGFNGGTGTATVVYQGAFAGPYTLPVATFNNLTLNLSATFNTNGSGALTVTGDLTLNQAGTILNMASSITADTLQGSGTFNPNPVATPKTLALTGTGAVLTVSTLSTFVSGGSVVVVDYRGATPTVRDIIYGDLTISGPSTTAAFGATAVGIRVQRNMSFSNGSTIANTTSFTFSGTSAGAFSLGSATHNLAGVEVNKSATSLTLSGTGTNQKQIRGLEIIAGTFVVETDLFLSGINHVGVFGNPVGAATLRVVQTGVDLRLHSTGSGSTWIHDRFEMAGASLSLEVGANTDVTVTQTGAVMSLAGIVASKLVIRTTVATSQCRFNRVFGGFLTASNVSVRDNDANGVVDGTGNPDPIVATSSVDATNNLNWNFQGGGSLLMTAVTMLGDGTGSFTRARIKWSLPLDFGTVAGTHPQFKLVLTDGSGNPLTTIAGTSASVVPSANSDTLEIRFGTGLQKTDITNVEVSYTPPATNSLTSTDQIPANTAQTASEDTSGGDTRLVDGEAPALVSVFWQDLDLNNGLDRVVFFFSEPVKFSSPQGVSVSGYKPGQDMAASGGNTFIYLTIAGETLPAIDIGTIGTPAGIASQIQSEVRTLMDPSNPYSTSIGHNPLNRPAFLNFTAEYDGERYVLRAGVPLRFNASSNTYVNAYTASSVTVRTGGALANNSASFLKLGTANEGYERAGKGSSSGGTSVGGTIDPNTISVASGTDVFLQVNGEGGDSGTIFRTFQLSITTNNLEELCGELEAQVRAAGVEALHAPHQDGYTEFVAIPLRTGVNTGRLLLVSGSQGRGSSMVIDSSSGFASIAQIGSSYAAAGAFETSGTDNTELFLDGLTVLAPDGTNLLAGRTVADMTISGSVVTIDLLNTPNSGTAAGRYVWRVGGDLGFIADRAPVENVATSDLSSLPGTSNVQVVGDTDFDLSITSSPGNLSLDVAGTVAPVGTAGITITHSWDFTSGPGDITTNSGSMIVTAPSAGIATGTSLDFAASASGTYLFDLVITIVDGSGNPVISSETDNLGRLIVPITVVITEDPPVASAGVDRVVVGTTITLDGVGSFDPNGGSIAVIWSARDSGGTLLPDTVFDDSSSLTPVFTPPGAGTYTVSILVSKVSDPTNQASDTAIITLTLPTNLVPVADAGPDLVARLNGSVTLDGSASADPEGNALTYSWSVVSSPEPVTLFNSATAQASFTPSVPGAFVFSLLVSDGTFSSQIDQVVISVIDDTAAQPRRGPAAVATVANLRQSLFLTTAPTQLTQSQLPTFLFADGSERAATVLDLVSDPTDDPLPSAVAGFHKVEVVVGGNLLATVYAPSVVGDALLQSVRFSGQTATETVIRYGVAGQAFVLDATESQDDGVVDTATWTQVGGPFKFASQSGQLVSVIPQSAGTYVFELYVVDNLGLGSFTQVVSVPVIPAGLAQQAGPPQAAATVSAGAATTTIEKVDTFTANPGVTLTLSAAGSLSLESGVPSPNGLTFTWQQLKGPTGVFATTTGQSVGFSTTAPGAYLFEVTATDGNGVSSTAKVWVSVGGPVAYIEPITPVQTLPTSGNSLQIQLNASKSLGIGGATNASLTYLFTQTAGIPAVVAQSQSRGSVRLDQPGTYTFQVRVIENGVVSPPAEVSFLVLAPAEAPLESGGSFKKSSGGCSLSAVPQRSGWAPWLLALLGLMLLAGRRRLA